MTPSFSYTRPERIEPTAERRTPGAIARVAAGKIRQYYRRWTRVRPVDPDSSRVERYLAVGGAQHRSAAR